MQKQSALTAWIHQDVFNFLKDEASSKLPNETGGILMGYWSKPYKEVVITNATGPGPEAEHSAGFYKPDNQWQHEEAIKIYEKYDVEYLGDWHSHPYPSDLLSWDDKQTLRTISRHKNGRVSSPIMLILHGKDEWMVTIWEFSPTKWTRFLPMGNISSMEIRISR
jgi:integrative and conjugative element protein (TIGR02256 family)